MSDNELAIVVLSIIFGSIVLIVGISKLSGLLKAWIERDKGGYDEEAFNRLGKAFVEHKKDMERRVRNLEAILADADMNVDRDDPSSYPQIEESGEENVLNNDLERKRKVR